jgi:hypothetical protein
MRFWPLFSRSLLCKVEHEDMGASLFVHYIKSVLKKLIAIFELCLGVLAY